MCTLPLTLTLTLPLTLTPVPVQVLTPQQPTPYDATTHGMGAHAVTPYGAGGYGVSFVNEPGLAAEARHRGDVGEI